MKDRKVKREDLKPMTDEKVKRTAVPVDLTLDILKREHADATNSYDQEIRIRKKREFILIILCLLAVIYTYPVRDFTENPTIDIPSISLKIPLKDAVAVFPTIIAAVYLIFLSSALSQSMLILRMQYFAEVFDKFSTKGEILSWHDFFTSHPTFSLLRYIFLPSPLHTRGLVISSRFHWFARLTLELFVGFVFATLPYATTVFLLFKSYSLLNSFWIVLWNSVCLVIMILALVSSALSSRYNF